MGRVRSSRVVRNERVERNERNIRRIQKDVGILCSGVKETGIKRIRFQKGKKEEKCKKQKIIVMFVKKNSRQEIHTLKSVLSAVVF